MNHLTLASVAEVVTGEIKGLNLSDREIERRTGIARTTLDRRLSDGDFRLSELTRIAGLLGIPLSRLVRAAEERVA